MSGSSSGAKQPMLPPGGNRWMMPTGEPTPAFFELIRVLWLRTGGSVSPTSPGGGVGIAALVAELQALQLQVNSVQSLTALGLLGPDDQFEPTVIDTNAIINTAALNAEALNDCISTLSLVPYDPYLYVPDSIGMPPWPLAKLLPVRIFMLVAGLVGSRAKLQVAPNANTSYPLQVNGAGVGSIDFAAGSHNATFTFTTAQMLTPVDEFAIMPPASVDPTAATLDVTFAGLRLAQ